MTREQWGELFPRLDRAPGSGLRVYFDGRSLAGFNPTEIPVPGPSNLLRLELDDTGDSVGYISIDDIQAVEFSTKTTPRP